MKPSKCLTLFVLCLNASACVGVRAYERGIHAKRSMQVNPDALAAALEQHVFEYREGSSGGYQVQGGSGCGCN